MLGLKDKQKKEIKMINTKEASHIGEAKDFNNIIIPNIDALNKQDSLVFLKLLDENASSFTFQTFDETSKKDPSLTRTLNGSLEDHFEELKELNKKGAGIFVTINETNLQGRKKEDIKKVRAVFLDLDKAILDPVYSSPLEPHCITLSSPGRHHIYWFCEGLELKNFEKVQTSLAKQYSGDTCVKDLPRIMRLPGFFHNKKDPFLTHIIETNCRPPYKADEILEAFKIDLDEDQTTHNSFSSNNSPLQLLKEKGVYIKEGSTKGIHVIKCPNAQQHTNGNVEAYFYEEWDTIRCFHQHCQELKTTDFKKMLGISEWSALIPLPNILSEVLPIMHPKNWTPSQRMFWQIK